MRRFACLFALALSLGVASAQSLSEYTKLRKQHKVTRPADMDALANYVGSKVIEIQGTVKGSFGIGDKGALMVERPGGDTLVVESETVPNWLQGNEIACRLLVKASRPDISAAFTFTLLGAAAEQDFARYEAQQKPQRSVSRAQTTTSRSAPTRPAKEWNLPASEVVPVYRDFIRKVNPRLGVAEADRIATGIVGFSIQFGVDPRLVMAIVMVESNFNPTAVSHAGAVGLGQLMPGTAKWMGVSNSYDSIDNLYGSIKLIRKHLSDYKRKTGQDFEALVLALAAYNAGDGAVRKHGGVPPYRETQAYVRKVIKLYEQFCGYR